MSPRAALLVALGLASACASVPAEGDPPLDAPPADAPDTAAPPDTVAPRDTVSPPDTGAPPDAPPDVAPDAPRDASPMDAAPDVSIDIPFDIPPDTSTDIAPDIAPDSPRDVPRDTALDLPPDRACPAVAAPPPDPDPWSVGLPTAGSATSRRVTAGGHTDLYLAGPAGVAEIAARLDWGGTVVFFGQQGMPSSNVIDANDTGRELQVALYDPQRQFQPCAWDASCRGTSPCGNSITFLGWDPVQGGDECNHGARVLRSAVEGATMVVAVRPMQWNPDWDARDCRRSACGAAGVEVAVTYTLAFRFVHSNVVEVAMELASEESLSHAPTEQEFPTLYVGHGGPSTDLPHLLDPAGTRIAIDLPANDGFRYRNFRSAGPWVTWQHAARDYGVALAMDHGGVEYQAWEGDGRSAPYFHNVRPRQSFGLPAGGTVRGRAYLALGGFDTVRSLMADVARRRPPFGALDAPARGATARAVGGRLRVTGWALDNAALAAVAVRVDGAVVATLPRAAARPDVCAVYPNYPGCATVGFDGEVTLPARDGCAHALAVVARDADGNETVLGRRLVVAD